MYKLDDLWANMLDLKDKYMYFGPVLYASLPFQKKTKQTRTQTNLSIYPRLRIKPNVAITLLFYLFIF